MSNLLFQDTLADRAVVITAVVAPLPEPAGGDRQDRPTMITVGIADERAVIKVGTLGNLMTLINEAWAEYAQLIVPAAASDEKTGVIATAPATGTSGGEQPAFSYSDDDF